MYQQQLTQQCRDQYDRAAASSKARAQNDYNYYTGILATIPSADYFAEKGLTFSSMGIEADQKRNEAQSQLSQIAPKYDADIQVLKERLQTCLNTIAQ